MVKSGAALIALGTNLPFQGLSGISLLSAALQALDRAELALISASNAWRSAAWPDPCLPHFVNAVALVESGGRDPRALMDILHTVERDFGRARADTWAPRTLDLDLLDVSGLSGAFNGVILPHPRLSERRFVLAPLAEVAPSWAHPITGIDVQELLANAQIGDGIQLIGPLCIARTGNAD